MQCEETEILIHGYLDGELDLERSLQIEQHLEGCTRCARLHERWRSLHGAMQSGTLYYRAPDGLRKTLRSTLSKSSRSQFFPSSLRWTLAGAAVAACAAFVVLWTLGVIPPASSRENQMAREILDSHIHSLLAGHLIDVPSSDQHTVKPWFDGKVDYSPTVKDLSGQGFILVGGRLDYVGGRTVGTVVYRRRQHVINLFTWPSSPAHGPASFSTSKQGYNIEAWNADGVEHWAVSDVNRDDLGEFVQLMRQ